MACASRRSRDALHRFQSRSAKENDFVQILDECYGRSRCQSQCGSLAMAYLRDNVHLPKVKRPISGRAELSAALDANATSMLLGNANEAFDTNVTELLLSAVMMAYTKATGNVSLAIEMEGHGREPWASNLDVTRTVAWFTSVFEVVFTPPTDDIVRSVKNTMRALPSNGFPFSMLRYLKRLGRVSIPMCLSTT